MCFVGSIELKLDDCATLEAAVMDFVREKRWQNWHHFEDTVTCWTHQVQLLLECRRGLEDVAEFAAHALTDQKVARRQTLENGLC